MADAGAAPCRSRRRRRIAVAGLITVVLVWVSLLGVRQVRDWQDDLRCRRLRAQPERTVSIRWDNGFTETEASWIGVLTDGVQQADAETREGLAAAVLRDERGWSDARRSLPAEARPAADRLHALVIDPAAAAARADSPEVDDDVTTVWRAASRECGFI